MEKQVTLAKEVRVQGVGLHSGVVSEVVLKPRAEGGVVLRRVDVGGGVFEGAGKDYGWSYPQPRARACVGAGGGKVGARGTIAEARKNRSRERFQ